MTRNGLKRCGHKMSTLSAFWTKNGVIHSLRRVDIQNVDTPCVSEKHLIDDGLQTSHVRPPRRPHFCHTGGVRDLDVHTKTSTRGHLMSALCPQARYHFVPLTATAS